MKLWNCETVKLWNCETMKLWNYETVKLWNCETVKLQNFSFFLSWIYEPILIKISMNANIKKTHIFYEMKYDLKGHKRSNKAFYVYLVQIILT